MSAVSLIAVLGAAAVWLILALLIPRPVVRPIVLGAALAVFFVFSNDNQSGALLTYALGFLSVSSLICLVRVPALPGRRSRSYLLAASWWSVVLVGSVIIAETYPLVRIASYGLACVLVAVVVGSFSSHEVALLLRIVLVVVLVEVALGSYWALNSIEPVWGYRNDDPRPNPLFDGAFPRGQGTLGHPIFFAVACAVGLLVVVTNPVRLGPVARITSGVVLVTGLAVSGTRSVIAAVLISCGFWLIAESKRSGLVRNAAVLLTAAGAALSFSSYIGSIVAAMIDSGSYEQRASSWGSLPTVLGRSDVEVLFGSGVGSEISLYTSGILYSPYNFQVVDNWIVYLLATQGIVGLGFFVALCAVLLATGDSTRRSLLILFLVLTFSFDLLLAPFPGVLFFLVSAIPQRTAALGRLRSTTPVVVRRRRESAQPLSARVGAPSPRGRHGSSTSWIAPR